MPCVREKTAIGVAVQEPKQVCQPVNFWMFWITCAVLGIVIAASGFTATPNATSKAKVKAIKLGRKTSFSLFILRGTFFLKRQLQIFYFFKIVADANVFEV
jgi:succinate-acetate transporter protein